MQLRTGLKVVTQLTRLPSGGERSRPRGHPRWGSLPKQTLLRKPRDLLRLQMVQSNWTHLWAVISRMVMSCIPPYMQMRMMQASPKSGQETGTNSLQPWDWPTASKPPTQVGSKYALLCAPSPHTALTPVAQVIVPLINLTSSTSHLYPIA